MNISLVCPSRNNLKYLKWSYASVRKNQGNHRVIFCIADDASTDGTWEWVSEMMKADPDIKAIRNIGPDRDGLTKLYNDIVYSLVETDIAMIWHADMYLCPGALDEVDKMMHFTEPVLSEPATPYTPKKIQDHKSIVSLTRIEPPLHPDGPEKYLADWGVEPEQFNETAFLQWFVSPEADGYKPKYNPPYTSGVFAPWAFFTKTYKEIGGHDEKSFKQSKDDSDIFNRFLLHGCKFTQTWVGCVYHLTSRGSRFNPTLTTVGTNSTEWETQNIISTRNFIRKWGHFVRHDDLMLPLVPPKYDIGIRLPNHNIQVLHAVEPFGSNVYVNLSEKKVEEYISNEKSAWDFTNKFSPLVDDPPNDIVITIDGTAFTGNDYNNLWFISDIIADSGVPMTHMTLGNMLIHIKKLSPIDPQNIINIQRD